MELLSNSKLDLETAGNGQEALDKFTYHAPGYYDIILMDMQMPVMDGCSASIKIRELEKKLGRRSVPIVAMTANVMQEDIKKVLDAGMNAHLSKPIMLEATLKMIEQQLGKN